MNTAQGHNTLLAHVDTPPTNLLPYLFLQHVPAPGPLYLFPFLRMLSPHHSLAITHLPERPFLGVYSGPSPLCSPLITQFYFFQSPM